MLAQRGPSHGTLEASTDVEYATEQQDIPVETVDRPLSSHQDSLGSDRDDRVMDACDNDGLNSDESDSDSSIVAGPVMDNENPFCHAGLWHCPNANEDRIRQRI